MRALQFISIGMSLASALIIISFLNGGDASLLNLAAGCGFLVAFYQTIVLIMGRNVLTPNHEKNKSTPEKINISPIEPKNILKAADTVEFVTPASVTENTTELLEPVLRYKAPKDSKH